MPKNRQGRRARSAMMKTACFMAMPIHRREGHRKRDGARLRHRVCRGWKGGALVCIMPHIVPGPRPWRLYPAVSACRQPGRGKGRDSREQQGGTSPEEAMRQDG